MARGAAGLLGVAGFAWSSLDQVMQSAEHTERVRVPQLTRIAEVELAVTREIDGQSWLGVWSGGEFFRIGLEP